VPYWRQRTSGHDSPIVGGDLNTGLRFREAADAYHEEKAQKLIEYGRGLEAELAYVRINRNRWILACSIACLILLGVAVTAKSGSASGGTATDSKGSAPTPKGSASTAPSQVTPRFASLPCAQGKWVTLLGAWPRKEGKVDDLFAKLREIQKRAASGNVALPLNYTLLDRLQCDALRSSGRDLYILWNGPWPSSAEAINVCHRLGWKDAIDDYWCYAASIDPAYSGRRHIKPDEGQRRTTTIPPPTTKTPSA
jgi:hypothetical protein